MTQRQAPSRRSRNAPPSMAGDRARRSPAWRWPLRVVAGLLAVMLWTQPLLIGLFLAGDFDKLAAHALVGGLLVGMTFILFAAAVLAWRPGRLPGWVVAVAGAMWVGGLVQIAAGYQRNLGLHLPLGVALAAAGTGLAVRAWWPTRSDRQPRAGHYPDRYPVDRQPAGPSHVDSAPTLGTGPGPGGGR
ncbi:MAG: hypothetical protein ABWZ98_05785 [Nakamurella sp.]